MMKKTFAVILATMMLLTLLAGCGSAPTTSVVSQTASEELTNTPETEVPSVVPGKKGTLEIWTMFTGADGAAFPNICDAYNATNPDYTVQHRAMVAEDLYLKLQMAVSSGEGVPDMAMNHIERIPLFAEEGRVMDLTPYLSSAGISKENYNATGWEMTDLEGGHYGVPLDVHSYILWVNMDLYEKYSLTDLDDGVLTWDELEATAQKVKADGVIPIGLSWYRMLFLSSYGQLGGVLSEDGVTPSFDNEIAKQVLEKYTSLVQKGYSQADGVDSWKEFTGGNVLYEPEGVWMYNAVKDSGINAKAFDFPVFDATKKGNATSSHQITLPTQKKPDAERIAACMDFIKFVEEHAADWSVAGLVPAAKSALEDDAFKEMPQYFLASEDEELVIFHYKYFGTAVEALDKVLGDIMFGKLDIAEGLKQAQQQTKDLVEMS